MMKENPTVSSTQPAPAITAVENVPGGGFIVAIDGPSGTGKSTVSRRLAQIADAKYLDTGAMYRVATLHVLRNGIDPESEDFADAVIAATADLPLVVNEDPTSTEVLLDGEDVSGEIRGADVTQHVSAVSAIPEVRENLVALQRSLALDAGRCVVEGRDIGTAVFSEAACKIYMTASAEIRARRRYDQDVSAGREVDFDAVLADVERRDAADSSRTVSPLRPANDANLIDTGDMDVDQVLDTIVGLVVESGTASASDAASAEEPEELVFRTTDGTVLNDGNAGSSESDDAAEVSEVTVDDTEFDDIVAEEDYISSEEEFFEDYDEDDFVDGAESAYTPDIDSFDLLTADAEDTDWSAVEDAFGVLGDEQAEQEALCTVAIVGRPNVGKSTLVNRFIGRREAVVEDFPGVTRDRISYLADWGGRRFWVQDTGGWDPDAKGIHGAIARQAETAMATADVIVFVVDTKVGITSTDELIARRLQRSAIPVVLVANKFDSDSQFADMAEFWSLGLDDPFPVSAQHGRGAAERHGQGAGIVPGRAPAEVGGHRAAPSGTGGTPERGQILAAEQDHRRRALGGRQCRRHHRGPGGLGGGPRRTNLALRGHRRYPQEGQDRPRPRVLRLTAYPRGDRRLRGRDLPGGCLRADRRAGPAGAADDPGLRSCPGGGLQQVGPGRRRPA